MSRYDEDHDPFIPVTKDKAVREDFFHPGSSRYGVALFDEDKLIGCSLAFPDFEDEIDEDEINVTALHGYAVGKTYQEEAEYVQAMYSSQVKMLKESGYNKFYI